MALRYLRLGRCKFMYYVIIVLVLVFVSYQLMLASCQSFRYSKKYITNSISPIYVDHTKNINSTVNPALKYILQWTPAETVPFEYMGVGQQGFIDRNCTYTNCYVTANRNYLGDDYTNFDVIAFSGPQVSLYSKQQLPQKRSQHQKYVFASIESAAYYPVCKDHFDGFFNWTWTFKTDSDSRWGYLVVRDMEGNVLGPNTIMHWIEHEDMLPVLDVLKNVLHAKKKTAAWFVSNCKTISNRRDFVNKLNKELQSKYNLSVDIYGMCGDLRCSEENFCNEMIRKDYHFYLSFENSFSEDYVTEKLTRALENNAIPIVYGGANYTRFMPDGGYLDARKLGVENLAAKIHELMNDFDQYADYFRWTNHYRYHRRDATVDTNDYCAMCTILNDEGKVKQVSMYKEFRKWWNNQNSCGQNLDQHKSPLL